MFDLLIKNFFEGAALEAIDRVNRDMLAALRREGPIKGIPARQYLAPALFLNPSLESAPRRYVDLDCN